MSSALACLGRHSDTDHRAAGQAARLAFARSVAYVTSLSNTKPTGSALRPSASGHGAGRAAFTHACDALICAGACVPHAHRRWPRGWKLLRHGCIREVARDQHDERKHDVTVPARVAVVRSSDLLVEPAIEAVGREAHDAAAERGSKNTHPCCVSCRSAGTCPARSRHSDPCSQRLLHIAVVSGVACSG